MMPSRAHSTYTGTPAHLPLPRSASPLLSFTQQSTFRKLKSVAFTPHRGPRTVPSATCPVHTHAAEQCTRTQNTYCNSHNATVHPSPPRTAPWAPPPVHIHAAKQCTQAQNNGSVHTHSSHTHTQRRPPLRTVMWRARRRTLLLAPLLALPRVCLGLQQNVHHMGWQDVCQDDLGSRQLEQYGCLSTPSCALPACSAANLLHQPCVPCPPQVKHGAQGTNFWL